MQRVHTNPGLMAAMASSLLVEPLPRYGWPAAQGDPRMASIRASSSRIEFTYQSRLSSIHGRLLCLSSVVCLNLAASITMYLPDPTKLSSPITDPRGTLGSVVFGHSVQAVYVCSSPV